MPSRGSDHHARFTSYPSPHTPLLLQGTGTLPLPAGQRKISQGRRPLPAGGCFLLRLETPTPPPNNASLASSLKGKRRSWEATEASQGLAALVMGLTVSVGSVPALPQRTPATTLSLTRSPCPPGRQWPEVTLKALGERTWRAPEVGEKNAVAGTTKMGKQKKAKKYAAMKRMISLRDQRIPKYPSCLFFQYNTQLGPPYYILVDTNFINFSIKAKLDLVQSMMDCLYAKCIPCITDCVMAEIEKLGQKYRVALRIAKDPRFERLPCTHKGTYADDCLVQRVTQHKCYIVATVDRDLKRRIRKIPGVPIMYISNHRYNIERMPDDYGAPRF
ncbi:rRNA-processing protein FCF1 homolog [Podarcis lilfordi]|uniref:rRNA-processing protein FCF1 homolog n=1 Tax=Podarcis lilfordi TaxID=74358 RepID=A0AA35JS34_9SAUR|nr:rRNA-processing protein FCF1 homolog [Podarcis lilfordi]